MGREGRENEEEQGGNGEPWWGVEGELWRAYIAHGLQREWGGALVWAAYKGPGMREWVAHTTLVCSWSGWQKEPWHGGREWGDMVGRARGKRGHTAEEMIAGGP